MVVDAQVEPAVAEAAISRCFANDEQRRGLSAARIAAGAITCEQGVEESVREWRLGGLRVRREHRIHDLRPGEDVALDRDRVAGPPAGPGEATRAGVARGASVRVDDAGLSIGAALVSRRQGREHALGVPARGQRREAVRPVLHVRERLRRDGTDTRAGPWDDRPHGQELRGDGDPEIAGRGIASDDRERHRSARPSCASMAAMNASLSGAGRSTR